MDRIESAGGPEDPPGGPDPAHPTTPATDNNLLTPTTPQQRQRPQRPQSRSRRPSVRIQRLSSVSSLSSTGSDHPNHHEQQLQQRQSQAAALDDSAALSFTRSRTDRGSTTDIDEDEVWQGNRRRSSSEPRPGRWSSPPPIALSRLNTPMLPLTEETSNHSRGAAQNKPTDQGPPSSDPNHEEVAENPPQRPGTSRLRRTSHAAKSRLSRTRASTVAGPVPRIADNRGERRSRADGGNNRANEYDAEFVNVLDVIDPEVSALSTLTNVQNSLFVPDLFGFVNREPTYTLSPPKADPGSEEEGTTTDTSERLQEPSKISDTRPPVPRARYSSISSVLNEDDTRFAVLPDEHNLEGWSKEDVQELNDHVRHMLHSRRSKFKRAMKGFGQYISKPLGFFITLYATLITLFGLAWVLFLIGWVNVGGKQLYVINVIDNVLVALFAIMGDGLAPFRAVDTYHMIFIARYTFLTWKIREKRELPDLKNKNDLPTRREIDIDIEWGDTPKDEQYEFSVLNRVQQLRLIHHQNKFAKSHTFYKPHETVTHHAFPTRLLIAIVVVLDFHSMLQIALGSCTWSIDYHVRPFALTTVILCCSIVCNISGGVLITIGDRMTRKKDVVERMFRQKLTSEAIKIMKKRRRREEKRNASLSRISSGPSGTLSPQATPLEAKPHEGT